MCRASALVQLNDGVLSRPGVFEISPDRPGAMVWNLADRPELWEGTLLNLSSLIHDLIARRPGEPPLRDSDPATATLTGELMAHFRAEYDAFLERYGEVDRAKPEMPPYARWSTAEEQRCWAEQVDKSLRDEPKWGMVISRQFRRDLKTFSELGRELR